VRTALSLHAHVKTEHGSADASRFMWWPRTCCLLHGDLLGVSREVILWPLAED
jgi:hypothetical protein